ncbi:MAG: alpha/beta hydrolase, partial [Bacteroidaceae bacterium]|nr:alpha/beta hydrolase [Bacteroidaceae bacterium]
MKKSIFFIIALFASVSIFAKDRELLWPKNKMPYAQVHQIAAMTNEVQAKGFNPDKNRIAYIEWFEAPPKDKKQDACMVLISGGSYESCCDVGLINQWKDIFTKMGIQCVNLVYRTPRPIDMAIYQTAWADGQRAIRMIRKQAKERGFNPEKIGVISMSAGSHLALLLGTSALTPAYENIDALDTIPCHINWAMVTAPAYGTTDAEMGTPATRQGYGPDVTLSKV